MAKAVAVAEAGSAGTERLKGQFDRTKDFLADVRSEMQKVTTPSKEEVRSTTGVVLVCVFAFAFFFWVCDFLINHSVNALITKLTAH